MLSTGCLSFKLLIILFYHLQAEKGTPTIPGKLKSESKEKERKHKRHKDRDKEKDKEHKKHKHHHKDRSKDKDKEKKKDKSGHHDSGADHSKKHHEKVWKFTLMLFSYSTYVEQFKFLEGRKLLLFV